MAFDSRSSVVDFVNEHGLVLVPNNETLIPFRFASPQLKALVSAAFEAPFRHYGALRVTNDSAAEVRSAHNRGYYIARLVGRYGSRSIALCFIHYAAVVLRVCFGNLGTRVVALHWLGKPYAFRTQRVIRCSPRFPEYRDGKQGV